ncbi:MAG: hypothetical protein KBF78_14155 [Fuscovulum sp.]|nr:hypothetical protein [Fuscovulum sp.]
MVAYSFNPRFEVPIREGWKTQTIRAVGRRRHARPGEMIQLYCGLRTATCRKIVPDVRCTDAMRLDIFFGASGGIDVIRTDGVRVRDMDAFAVRDGFTDLEDMEAFWKAHHRGALMSGFRGVLIEWHMPRAAEAMGVAA